MFAGRRRSGERKNSRTDDRADPDASKIESGKGPFQLAFRRRRLGHQSIRALGLKSLRATFLFTGQANSIGRVRNGRSQIVALHCLRGQF